MRYDYVLFDLDGTLTESGPGIMKGVQYALHTYGIDETDETKLRLFIGPPMIDSFMRFYGFDEAGARKALLAYRAYYNDRGVYENEPYPGIREMLTRVREAGIHTAVATSKPQNMVDIVLDHFDLRRYFEIVVCGADSGPLFTKTGVVAEVLRQFALRDERTVPDITGRAVMVGDRKHDVEGAKNNGLRTIGVSWGYAPEGELVETGADVIANDAKTLADMLLETD